MTPYDNGGTKPAGKANTGTRPTRDEAEAAVETILRWIGEDVSREGLVGTPGRVVRAWEEFCAGYDDPAAMLSSTFEEVEGYDDMVMLRSIRMESHCEHHGAHSGRGAYRHMPDRRVVGISKLARSRQFLEAPANAGDADRTGRRLHSASAAACAVSPSSSTRSTSA